jgi:hypothetical protein
VAQLIVDQQDIARWIEEQKGPLDLAVAFWGRGAIEHLGLKKHKSCLRVLLDLSAGASNPSEVEKLMKLLPGRVRQVERLHAKAWIGASEVVIGSANASANGLGVEGSEAQHWCELGMRSSDQETVSRAHAWFDELWGKRSRLITDEALDQARKRWKIRRSMRPQARKTGHLLNAGIVDPDYFTDLRLYVVVVNKELSSDGEDERLAHEAETGVECHAYEDWKGIPLNATLIAFTNFKGDGIEMENPSLYETASAVLPGRLQLVYPKRRFNGLTAGPEKDWKLRLERYADRHPRRWRGGDICVEFNEFMRLTHP